MIVNFLLVVVSMVAMEGVAWFTHKHLMHGPLWFLHESHHVPHDGWFEKNDWFAVLFSLPSIALIWLGTNFHPRLLWVGIGVAAYGAAYFVFHDLVVHRRLRIPLRPSGSYMRRIIKAHLIHHKTLTKEGAVSFGFLYSPPLDRRER